MLPLSQAAIALRQHCSSYAVRLHAPAPGCLLVCSSMQIEAHCSERLCARLCQTRGEGWR